jgi:hypothetical protein
MCRFGDEKILLLNKKEIHMGKVWSGSSERSGSCVGFASSPNKRGGGALLLLIR